MNISWIAGVCKGATPMFWLIVAKRKYAALF
jgi:hypothetical protein